MEENKNLLNIILEIKILSKKNQEISIKVCHRRKRTKKRNQYKKNMEKIGIKNEKKNRLIFLKFKNELLLVYKRKSIEKCMG